VLLQALSEDVLFNCVGELLDALAVLLAVLAQYPEQTCAVYVDIRCDWVVLSGGTWVDYTMGGVPLFLLRFLSEEVTVGLDVIY
jgi:hypothetical protein